MMNKTSTSELVVPRFENESDEAEWWFQHRESIERDMAAALAKGSSIVRYNLAPAAEKQVITLAADDAKLARELAAERGETYEAFVRRVVHEALQLEKSA